MWAGDLLAAQNRDVDVLLSLFGEDFFSDGAIYFDSGNAEAVARACSAVRLCLRERFLLAVGDEASSRATSKWPGSTTRRARRSCATSSWPRSRSSSSSSWMNNVCAGQRPNSIGKAPFAARAAQTRSGRQAGLTLKGIGQEATNELRNCRCGSLSDRIRTQPCAAYAFDAPSSATYGVSRHLAVFEVCSLHALCL